MTKADAIGTAPALKLIQARHRTLANRPSFGVERECTGNATHGLNFQKEGLGFANYRAWFHCCSLRRGRHFATAVGVFVLAAVLMFGRRKTHKRRSSLPAVSLWRLQPYSLNVK